MWSDFLSKLDVVIGAGMLMVLAIMAMILGYDHGTAQMCITGVVALLTAKVVRGNTEKNG